MGAVWTSAGCLHPPLRLTTSSRALPSHPELCSFHISCAAFSATEAVSVLSALNHSLETAVGDCTTALQVVGVHDVPVTHDNIMEVAHLCVIMKARLRGLWLSFRESNSCSDEGSRDGHGLTAMRPLDKMLLLEALSMCHMLRAACIPQWDCRGEF